MEEKEVIIVPDTHCRDFWKVVRTIKDIPIVFLGDYVDPYENLDPIIHLNEIIDFAKSNDNVHLLLGNHECHYLSGEHWSRRDYANAKLIKKLLVDNEQLFNIAYDFTQNGKHYICSHAGIMLRWLNHYKYHTEKSKFISESDLCLMLNRTFKVKPELFTPIPIFRGGMAKYGSPINADFQELKNDQLITSYQIIGHTKFTDPMLYENIIALDCQRVFKLINNKIEEC